jgi:hypothetical protein
MSTQTVREVRDPPPAGAWLLDSVGESSVAQPVDDAQIDEIVERLRSRYTRDQISITDLGARVRGAYRQFDAARLRSFVSILVEGLVRRSIAKPARSPEAF